MQEPNASAPLPDPFAVKTPTGEAPRTLAEPDDFAHRARFNGNQFLVRRKILKLIGADFYVDDANGRQILFAHQKGFKLKEDIRLFTGEDKQTEILRIGARNILDVSATYDVWDSSGNQKLGAFRRRGFKSMIQDEWTILDNDDREIGTLKEDSLALALVRRFIDFAKFFLPQSYTLSLSEHEVGEFKQTRNPLVMKIQCDFSQDAGRAFDRRLGIAAAVLLCAIEGRQ